MGKSTPNRVKHLRNKHNLSLRELEKRTGINYSVISRIESGDRPLNDNELKIFADLFDVSVDYLIGRTDEPVVKDNNPINISFRDGGEEITEEEAEYLEQQLKQFRELRKKFQQNNE
ncbi:hypothetical protein BKP37_12915 [Anaerobacillus alkalilacustris]|uniref:HTH cro/C1-type domain-containing protein n=1 Tax=Anaerobacillus alkalilacustris TaxID=393763 RepID=A0A1S2LMP2_9BACI|nr:helix-turn-helix transcriptional regulator [Anaerobacillus alkalilacustris]OIJ12695.1 hypothetical protein BKP37_12915 [Anaerobacillus alkalilacustris]